MKTWVVLLRGVNVGGANRLSMSDLRSAMSALGHTEVTTYIQSGNAVIKTPRSHRDEIASEIAERIKRDHGLGISAILRTPAELRAAVAANPFTEDTATSRVLITFLSATPKKADVGRLELERFLPDRFEIHRAELYCYYANGAGRSKMTLDYFEKRLGVRGTGRNLNTVGKLIELAG